MTHVNDTFACDTHNMRLFTSSDIDIIQNLIKSARLPCRDMLEILSPGERKAGSLLLVTEFPACVGNIVGFISITSM